MDIRLNLRTGIQQADIMATKADLEGREGGCASIDDYVALAKEALAEPADRDYAKHLLQQAEALCQMPLDYLGPADVAVSMLGDADYARELYDQAEDMLFDAQEHLAFARSMAEHMRDTDKAREHVETAAGDAGAPAELLSIAHLARTSLGDTALADSLLAKVQEGVHGMDDAKKLVASLLESGDEASARAFFAGAARYCDDVAATADYARDVKSLFSDDGWARKTLDDAEMDCQFTGDFVALATGYRDLFGDTGKVAELMEQAAEFCMTGEEQLDLAEGLFALTGDREGAAAAYDKALADVTDKDMLLGVAGKIAKTLGASEDAGGLDAAAVAGAAAVAKRYYAKAEEKISTAAELAKLARAVTGDLGDRDYAGEIYDRAIEKLMNPGDLANVAGELAALGDTVRATAAYRKAFERAGDAPALIKLATAIVAKPAGDIDGASVALAREVVEKALEVAKGTPELISAGVAASEAGAADLARRALEAAEERVTSLGEIRNVAEQVSAGFPDDAAWIARVEDKKARREANQAKYAAFQGREKRARGALDLVALADAVMDELDDRFYVEKLLDAAEQRWTAGGHDPVEVPALAIAIDHHLEDPDRIESLMKQAAERAARLPALANLGRFAVSKLRDRERGATLARSLYAAWENDRLGEDAREHAKLARIVSRDLADRDWVERLVRAGIGITADPLETTELAIVATLAGLDPVAASARAEAADRCASPRDALHVAARFLAAGACDAGAREFYASVREKFSEAGPRLAWAQGIVELFSDRDWAEREVAAVAEMPSDEATSVRLPFRQGERRRSGARFW